MSFERCVVLYNKLYQGLLRRMQRSEVTLASAVAVRHIFEAPRRSRWHSMHRSRVHSKLGSWVSTLYTLWDTIIPPIELKVDTSLGLMNAATKEIPRSGP